MIIFRGKLAGKTVKNFLKGLVKVSNPIINKKSPVTKEFIDNSVSKNTKSTPKMTVKNNQDKSVKKLKKSLDLPEREDIPRVHLYSEDSEPARTLNNSKDIKKAVSDWKHGKIKDENGNPKNKFVVCLNGQTDTRRAFNGCTLCGLEEHEDGTITGYVWDVWDFNKEYTDQSGKSKSLSFPNKVANFLQQTGVLKQYQVLIPITIKPTDIKA